MVSYTYKHTSEYIIILKYNDNNNNKKDNDYMEKYKHIMCYVYV